MLHSVQRGIAALPTQEASADFDAVLIVPGDVPAFSPKTVAALIKQAAQSDAEVICPAHGQAGGHPWLVKRKCFKPICSYDGEGGLRQALAPSLRECLDVDDEAILLDADTPEAFGRLEEYVLASKGVSDEIAAALFERFSTPKNVQAHCRAVAKLATRMASHLNKQGYGLDSKLCRSAALLHDLNRLQEHHAHVAAENLRALGYEAIAKIVQVHQDGIDLSEEMFSETNIVFLADKLVRETEIVTPKTRYAKALERFSASPEITKRITQDLELSEELLKN
jgi:putative nucleotidyltransferase with HDIG domain